MHNRHNFDWPVAAILFVLACMAVAFWGGLALVAIHSFRVGQVPVPRATPLCNSWQQDDNSQVNLRGGVYGTICAARLAST